MNTRTTLLAMTALALAACGDEAAVPTQSPTAMVAETDAGPAHRGQMIERLREAGDAEAQALLDRAEAARQNAHDAFQAGDREQARIYMLEARGYMHTAMIRTFPDMAEHMAQENCNGPGHGRKGARMGAEGERMSCGRRGSMHTSDSLRVRGEGCRMSAMSEDISAEAQELLDAAAASMAAARVARQGGDYDEAQRHMRESRRARGEARMLIDPEATPGGQNGQQRMHRRGMGMRSQCE